MDIWHIGLAAALIVTALLLWSVLRLWRAAVSDLRGARSSSRSLSTKYGQMTEQFMPFIPDYPWNPHNFRFIGSPIDGVQFEEDKVVIVEFKTATSKLTARQRSIRDLVRDGRVEFEEFRIG